MFSSLSSFAIPISVPDGTRRTPPPPTTIQFPTCTPQVKDPSTSIRNSSALFTRLRAVQRPADVDLALFEALGLHVLPDASPEHVIPDATFLPPAEQWRALGSEALAEANLASRKPLNNGVLSPGIQTYFEREQELSIDNTVAFRTVRRLPPNPGELPCRLGNAYEFFKNLEYFSNFWVDTSLPPGDPSSTNDVSVQLQTHVRTSTGASLPGEYRHQLVSAFIKLVAYDFGCNVSFSRCEPRLYIIPPSPATGYAASPASYFSSSNMSFIYRTPRDRASARMGIVEGPLVGISCRATTGFSTEAESQLDLARETVCVLLTAQQRAREGKEERRFGHGKWWTEKKRWGGGKGGTIGREGDMGGTPFFPPVSPAESEVSDSSGSPGPSPNKKARKGIGEGKTFQVYEAYRKMLPPSPTWDRKARYCAIGRAPGQTQHDDVFLVSSLNHHICIIRTRMPVGLMNMLDGTSANGGWDDMVMWRSKWFDLFLKSERIAAMQMIWGMMAWLMRALPLSPSETPSDGTAGPGEKMLIDT